LCADRVQLPPAFPNAGQCLSQFLVGDVEVSLRCLDKTKGAAIAGEKDHCAPAGILSTFVAARLLIETTKNFVSSPA
jgi:hypothetical protein